MADALQTHGYQVYLAHPAANQQYNGYKHTNDKTDVRWLALLLQLGLLKTGHIYPKEQRGLRELLRQRMRLVQLQTTLLLGLQALVMRYGGVALILALWITGRSIMALKLTRHRNFKRTQ